MKINITFIKIVLIFCVGIFLPWGRNSLVIGIYPPLFFVVSTLCLAAFLPITGIKVPPVVRWFLLFIIIHIILTVAILGKDYLFLAHVETQFLGSGQSYIRPGIVLSSIGQILFLISFLIIMSSVIQNKKEWIAFSFSFVCGLALVCFLKLATYNFFIERFTGGYNDANVFGISACVALFLSLMLLIAFKNYLLKITTAFLALFFLIMILLSQSRGAFLALLIGGSSILKNRGVAIYKILVSLVIVAVVLLLIRPLFPERFVNVNLWIEDRGSKRLDIWIIYLSHLRDFFLTGVGFSRSAEAISTGVLRMEYITHNIFLEILAEFGIVGFVLFSSVLKKFWTSINGISRIFPFANGVKPAFLSWLIGSCFISSFSQRETWFIFALMASLPALIGYSCGDDNVLKSSISRK
jgi:O-antigen ligase